MGKIEGPCRTFWIGSQWECQEHQPRVDNMWQWPTADWRNFSDLLARKTHNSEITESGHLNVKSKITVTKTETTRQSLNTNLYPVELRDELWGQHVRGYSYQLQQTKHGHRACTQRNNQSTIEEQNFFLSLPCFLNLFNIDCEKFPNKGRLL